MIPVGGKATWELFIPLIFRRVASKPCIRSAGSTDGALPVAARVKLNGDALRHHGIWRHGDLIRRNVYGLRNGFRHHTLTVQLYLRRPSLFDTHGFIRRRFPV
jgi:hypothetical protein